MTNDALHRADERAFGIYNPAALSAADLLEEFVARRPILEESLEIIRGNHRDQPQQHLLFLGPRGMGKTMMLLAIAHSLERDTQLSSEWIPVVFPEEAYYAVADLADFWLKANEYLFDKLGRGANEIKALHDFDGTELEDRARELLIRTVEQTGKRAILFVENLGEFFEAVSDPADQHRLRAFLMDDDRVMLTGSATSYFEAVAEIDRPFFDFFRVFRLKRFTREETFEALQRVAEARDDRGVLAILDSEPQRVEGLRILTGGNPRLIKVIYRLLREGAFGDVRRDLDRLLDDCTPYFKHRIEKLSGEQRRVFDRVARQWDPVAVKDLERDLRRPSNKISTYLRRLVAEGFLEEVPGSTETRKRYQVAERFYNIYYLMRFSRTGRHRLEWLSRYMQVLYTPEDYRQWVERVLRDWRSLPSGRARNELVEFLYALTSSAEGDELRRELVGKVIEASWNEDQLASLHDLLDLRVARDTLHGEVSILEFLSNLNSAEKKRIGYRPDDAGWWFRLANELEESEAWEAAQVAYRCSIELDPENAVPWISLGILLQENFSRYGDAEAAYQRSIELNPELALSWVGLGSLLRYNPKRSEEAEAAYRRAIELNPSLALPWLGLGNLWLGHPERLEEAKAAYRRAIELDPSNPEAWNNLGNLLQEHPESVEESVAAYRHAIELNPELAIAWNGLGNVLHFHFERFEEAEAAYRHSIKLNPNLAYPRAGLAVLLERQDRHEEASAHARTSVLRDPNAGWTRSVFLQICGIDALAWIEILPASISNLATTSDEGLHEFVVRGLVHLAESGAAPPSQLVATITAAGGEQPLAEILLALRAADDPELLATVAPERRSVAEDLLARIGRPIRGKPTDG